METANKKDQSVTHRNTNTQMQIWYCIMFCFAILVSFEIFNADKTKRVNANRTQEFTVVKVYTSVLNSLFVL